MKAVRKNIGVKISLTLGIIASLSYGTLFTYFDHTNQFPIKNIKIIGTYDYVNTEDIQKTLTPFVLTKGLFAFDEMKAEAALKQLPGIQDVSIWRIPPDKIRVILR